MLVDRCILRVSYQYCIPIFQVFSNRCMPSSLWESLNCFPVSWQATLWSVIIYFMTGLSVDDGGWHFWVYYLIMTLSTINGASLVRFMAFFAPDRDAANAIIGIYSCTWCIQFSFSVCKQLWKIFICAHTFFHSRDLAAKIPHICWHLKQLDWHSSKELISWQVS